MLAAHCQRLLIFWGLDITAAASLVHACSTPPGAHRGVLLNARLEKVKIDVFNHFSLFHLGSYSAHAGDTVNVTQSSLFLQSCLAHCMVPDVYVEVTGEPVVDNYRKMSL